MSIGALKRQTKNFLFNIINFNFARWHGYEHENWDLIDAILSVYVTSGGLKGIWKNSTIYAANDRVIDTDTSDLWLALVPHTSAATPTTFAADRAANPTYWRSITYDPQNRGAWSGPGTVYGVNDFITSGNRYGVADKDFVSGASYDADVAAGNITTLIDLDTAPFTGALATETANRIAADNLRALKAGDVFTGAVALEEDLPLLRWSDTNGVVNKRKMYAAYEDDRLVFVSEDDAFAGIRVLGGPLHDGGWKLDVWTTATRPATAEEGLIGYNQDTDQFEGYAAGAWGSLGGGATGAAGDQVFMLNDQTVDNNYTIPSGKNAVSAGPITISAGITVTISSGSTWTVV